MYHDGSYQSQEEINVHLLPCDSLSKHLLEKHEFINSKLYHPNTIQAKCITECLSILTKHMRQNNLGIFFLIGFKDIAKDRFYIDSTRLGSYLQF